MVTKKWPFKQNSIWQWVLLTFVIAALTGFLFRYGFVANSIFGFDFAKAIDLANVRQAHTHLMFFGWAGLLILYFIGLSITNEKGENGIAVSRLMRSSLYVILVFSLFSYPSFFQWGYKLVPVGSAELPISAMLSSGVMIGWYIFIAGYWKMRIHLENESCRIWYDGALLMLFISSLGAWSVGAVQMFGFGNEFFERLLPHFFLTTYTEGWILMGLIGILVKTFDLKKDDYIISDKILAFCVTVGAPISFPFGMPGLMANPYQASFARVGSFIISISVLLFVISLFKTGKLKDNFWKWPLLFLAIKSVMQLVATFLPYGNLLTDRGIKVLYLHMLFLGAYTSTIVVIFSEFIKNRSVYIYAVFISIILLLLSLVFNSVLLPNKWFGYWVFKALAIAAPLPIITISILWIKLLITNKN